MRTLSLILLVSLPASAATAEEVRHLGAHEHGVGQLYIAIDSKQIAMELHAPGADIVGFEYAATSAEDRGKIDAAVAMLARPLELFSLPDAAQCSVVQASAGLEGGKGHDHEAHGDETHDAHKDHDHAEHADHDHAEHVAEAAHTEFHAQYQLSCENPAELDVITFAYFETFPNAVELEVQLVTAKGATAFEVDRAAPTLDLRDMF